MAEAAVVGRPDDTTGEAICAFVVLKRARPTGDEAKKIANELRNWVAKEIGPIAKPKDIRFGDNLPKTRSGKIMRRLLRSLAKGEAITQDTTTLENPAILEQLRSSTSRRASSCRAPHAGHFVPRRYLALSTHVRQLLRLAGLTFGLAGIGTGPQTPAPPLHDLLGQLGGGVLLAGVLGGHVLVGRPDDLAVHRMAGHAGLLLGQFGAGPGALGRDQRGQQAAAHAVLS